MAALKKGPGKISSPRTSVARPVKLRNKDEKTLKKAKNELELKVRERTLELESVVRSLHNEIAERKKVEAEVMNIAKGVSAAVGEKFFYSLIEHLAKILEADYAYIAKVIKEVPDSVRTLALYADGTFIDNIEVNLTGTPCDTVREKTCCYPSGVQRLFPEAKTMALMNVEGYAGTPLYSSTGEWLGIMAVMYRRPVKNEALVMSLLRIFAARAAAELERKEAEEELLIMNRAIESSINGIALADLDGNLKYVNPSFLRMWGYEDAEEVVGQPAVRFCKMPGDAIRVIKTLLEKGSWIGELTALKRDGTSFFAQLSSSMVKDDTGRPLCMMSSFLDISEQKKAGQQLKDSERKYRDIVDNAIVGVVKTNLDGDVLYVNDAFARMLEYGSTGELIKEKAVTRYKDPGRREAAVKMIREKGRLDNFEIDFITKTGQVKNMLVSSVLEGDIITTLLVDITERKRAEEALLNYKNQLQAVKDIGALANSTLNIERVLQNILAGTIKAAGASAGMIFVRSSDNTLRWGASIGLSETFVASFTDKHIKPGEGLTGRIFQTGAPIYIERDSSHDPRVVRSIIKDEGLNSFIGVPVLNGDEIIGVLNILTHQHEVLAEDKLALVSAIGTHVGSAVRNAILFSERREAENAIRKANEEIARWNAELERRVREYTDELVKSHEHLVRSEKLSAMGQMAAGLAHELNSPLAGLLPMIEKYRNEAEKGSRAHKELSVMLNACGHMARIVRDFSMFSRESKGEYAMLNLNEIIEDTLSFSAGTFNHGKIQLIKRYDDRLPSVMGEKTGLQQVVLNMIKNACDAMPEGGELVMKTFRSEDKKNVIMEFIDNGSGIAKEDLDKIFDPFFTTKRPGKGTGLGLSVSYNIIEKHGGRISVASELGKGTKFSIHLPAVRTGNITAEG